MTPKLCLSLLGAALLLASCGGGDGTPGPDTTAPSVTLGGTLPTTPGDLTLTATVTDNVGVTKVEFYRNGTLISTDDSAPYEATVTLDQRDNGAVTFSARAYDAAGNVGEGGLNTTVNINTLYQGQWSWIAFTDPNNVEGSIQAEGAVVLFDQFASSKNKTIAYGAYYAAQPNLTGDAYLGDLLADGSLGMDLVYPDSEQSYLLGLDEDGLTTVEGTPVFVGAAALFTPDGTLSQNLYVGMVQTTTNPFEGFPVSGQGLNHQATAQTKARALAALKTLAAQGKLNRLAHRTPMLKAQNVERLKR